jgi:hypothetical protein
VDRLTRDLSRLDKERDMLQTALDGQQEAAAEGDRDRASLERALR